jgi:hypothetical protein
VFQDTAVKGASSFGRVQTTSANRDRAVAVLLIGRENTIQDS